MMKKMNIKLLNNSNFLLLKLKKHPRKFKLLLHQAKPNLRINKILWKYKKKEEKKLEDVLMKLKKLELNGKKIVPPKEPHSKKNKWE